MRNEFSSEKLGSRVPNCTRKEYSEILAVHFITEDRNKAKAQKEYQTRGTKKYTKEGIIDRLSAKPYNFSLIAPRKSSRDGVNLTGDERSYYYGYYTLGTEKIAIQLKYPDVKRMATIEEIGYNDAKSGISLADLPKEIKENNKLKISRRDFLKVVAVVPVILSLSGCKKKYEVGSTYVDKDGNIREIIEKRLNLVILYGKLPKIIKLLLKRF